MPSPIPLDTLLHNRYRIIEALRQGDYGWAYVAEDLKRSHERCVLEEFIPLKTDDLEALRERFQQEVSLLTQLHHPQIPRFRVIIIHRSLADELDRRLFWVRDYVDGCTYRALLNQRLAQGYVFSEAEALNLLLNLLPVLSDLHDRDIIHQNLNLDSVVLRSSDQLPVLIEFGLVREVALTLQLASHSIGNWGYAPLEQRLSDRVARDSDFYALSAIAVVLLTGREPEELYDDKTQRWSWQEWAVVSPQFAQVLERMLSPNPSGRYSTAGKVAQALRRLALKDQEKHSNSKIQPSKLKVAQTSVEIAELDEPPRRDLAFLILVFIFTGLTTVTGWRILSLLRHEPTETTAAQTFSSSESNEDEQKTQEALRDDRKRLGISFNVFTDLVDELFYAQHPQLQNRSLDTDPKANQFRAEWNALAETVLKKLETLSQEARSKLGHYDRASYNGWLTEANQLKVSSRSLSALTDVRFGYLFPQQRKPLNPRKFGQVWYAIAHDQVSAFRDKSALRHITAQTFNDQNTLKPGQGKVYVLQINQGQTLKVALKAPDRATRLSIFPFQETPPLLQDSANQSWSAKVNKTGSYELVIASQTTESISYQLFVKSGS
ncbi:MAG: protein kinase [Phormidesmis sp. CAN_BIN36]|nr:protein kinase [Phormidesmis sp. CAN_BIN36]